MVPAPTDLFGNERREQLDVGAGPGRDGQVIRVHPKTGARHMAGHPAQCARGCRRDCGQRCTVPHVVCAGFGANRGGSMGEYLATS